MVYLVNSSSVIAAGHDSTVPLFLKNTLSVKDKLLYHLVPLNLLLSSVRIEKRGLTQEAICREQQAVKGTVQACGVPSLTSGDCTRCGEWLCVREPTLLGVGTGKAAGRGRYAGGALRGAGGFRGRAAQRELRMACFCAG